MRINTPLVNTIALVLLFAIKVILDAIMSVLAVVLLFPVFLVMWCLEGGAAEEGVWKPWFAWRPATLPASADLVWLEQLEYTKFRGYTYYRRRGDLTVPMPVDDYDGE